MEKKIKKALIGYLNNAGELYSLYTQDSWSDEDFLTGAVADWTLDIMEGFINDKNVVPVLKLIRRAISEGTRVLNLPYNDLGERGDDEVYNSLIEEAESLKRNIEKL